VKSTVVVVQIRLHQRDSLDTTDDQKRFAIQVQRWLVLATIMYYAEHQLISLNSVFAQVMTARFGGNDSEEPDYAYLRGPNFVTIIICSVVILMALIGVGVYLTIEQRRRLSRKNRRF
jgi:hypothetical protein